MARRNGAESTALAALLRFRTETGSVYEVRREDGGVRWARVSTTGTSGVLPLEGGYLAAWPSVMPGYRTELVFAEEDPSGYGRVVTSRVVELLEGTGDERLGPGDLATLAFGDVVARNLAGMLLALPYLGTRDGMVFAGFGPPFYWTFDEATGAEVDEELEWGPAFGQTGSYLVGVRRGALADRADGIAAIFPRVAYRVRAERRDGDAR